MIKEWWFVVGLVIVIILAWIFIALPLRKKARILSFPLVLIAVSFLYWQWGSWDSWHQHEAKLRQLERLKIELSKYKSPEMIIEKLKLRLKENPKSPKGWYLLGRLYLGQERWQLAENAFAHALQLSPKDEAIQVNYLLSLWEQKHRQFDAQSKDLLTEILKNNPKQPDALVIAAKEAYDRQDKKQAVQYWQTLLTLVPPDSRQADFLRKTIAKTKSE